MFLGLKELEATWLGWLREMDAEGSWDTDSSSSSSFPSTPRGVRQFSGSHPSMQTLKLGWNNLPVPSDVCEMLLVYPNLQSLVLHSRRDEDREHIDLALLEWVSVSLPHDPDDEDAEGR